MASIHDRKSARLSMMLCFGLIITFGQAFAAGQTLRLEDDSNSRIVVENAIVNSNQTTILFWTWPDRGNPNSGKPCPLNFYSVTLRPGLPSAHATLLAQGVCGSGLSKSGLLDQGDVKIIARDRLEQWRIGKRISTADFASLDATRNLGVTSDDMGAQFYGFSPSGDLVIAMPAGGQVAQDRPGASLLITALKPDNSKRWQVILGDAGETFSVERLWAGQDGGALLYLLRRDKGSMIPLLEPQLEMISPSGNQITFALVEPEEPFDVLSVQPGSQEDLQKFFEHQENAHPESIDGLSARPRDGGGFDVLFQRTGGTEGRAGHFLYRFAADGTLQSETELGSQLEEHGLEKWTDFYVSGDELILLSKVMATQTGVQSRRTKWMQNVVSRVDLETGTPVSRLIPLDQRYLEAAMNAGDEGRQTLEGQPGGDPVLLTSVSGVPLAVEIAYQGGRNTLRLNEASEDLLVFSETYDERQAAVAREKARQKKKADRETQKEQMNADMAAAVDMTPDEYAALSNKERKQAMVREGDMDAMMAAAMKQAESAKQAMAASGASPEQLAQMEAAMAQVQQMAQGSGMTAAKSEPATADKAATPPVLEVDALLRGHVQYRNLDGKHTTLIVFNRDTGEELLNKEFADGIIDEYVNLGRYKLPLEKIGILIRNISGEILKDLTPEVSS